MNGLDGMSHHDPPRNNAAVCGTCFIAAMPH